MVLGVSRLFPVLQNAQWRTRATRINAQLPLLTANGAISKRTKKTVVDPRDDLNKTGRSAAEQADFGKIYDKKPFRFLCEHGKSYLWCSCGWSKTQPFCDSTHKNKLFKITMRPVRFIAPETKEYSFCNCKQTKKRPFCDGTHKREDIQAAVKS